MKPDIHRNEREQHALRQQAYREAPRLRALAIADFFAAAAGLPVQAWAMARRLTASRSAPRRTRQVSMG